jgi:hypothetical protein
MLAFLSMFGLSGSHARFSATNAQTQNTKITYNDILFDAGNYLTIFAMLLKCAFWARQRALVSD